MSAEKPPSEKAPSEAGTEKSGGKADWSWFENVYVKGQDLPGCICLVSPVAADEEWWIFNNTSCKHTEFCFTNDRELTKLIRDRAIVANKTNKEIKVLFYLTRLCGCRKKCLCHRSLREWLAEFISRVDFRFIFGVMTSLNKHNLNHNPSIWLSHMESLLSLMHFAELHPKLNVETISKDSYNEFVKANEFDESLDCTTEPSFYENGRKCLEGLKIYAENFDFTT